MFFLTKNQQNSGETGKSNGIFFGIYGIYLGIDRMKLRYPLMGLEDKMLPFSRDIRFREGFSFVEETFQRLWTLGTLNLTNLE